LTAIYITANLFFMTRPYKSVIVSNSKLEELKAKYPSTLSCFLSSVFCLLFLALSGCTPPPKEEPIWKDLKIGDLAPRHDGKQQKSRLVESTNFNLFVFEMPSDNIDKLNNIRKTMFTRNLRYQSSHAFEANSFSVHFGQYRMWEQIFNSIRAAGAKRINRAQLMLTDNLPETIAVIPIDSPRTIFYTAVTGSKEGANVGQGILGLRIKTQKVPALRGVCNFTAYPVYFPPRLKSTIPLLDARAQRREFPFSSAAFGLRMGPGDFILLGPNEYVSDQTALGGLFFSNPEGNYFYGKTEKDPLQHKSAVRLFLLVCTRTSY
jgi:hypothetical protein